MSERKKPCRSVWMNEDERQRLLSEQLPQVRYIARRIHERLPRHVPLEDLVHAGVVGLIDALEKFDRGKRVQFGSYAKFRIRGAILDSLRELDWGPRDLRRQARSIEDAHDRLRFQLGRHPSEPELAHELGMPLEELQKLLGNINALEIGSLRMISPRDGHEEDLSERVSADGDNTPLTHYLHSEMQEIVKSAIQHLPDRERQVLSLYYFEELTMKEIGSQMGVGESRVSQIHSMAVLRLRTQIAALTHSGDVPQRRAAAAASAM